jgi:hypothetical protein
VSKFVGKFRKNKEYNDDYNYTQSKRRNEHGEIKKILSQHEEELMEEDFNSPDELNWETNARDNFTG